MRLYNTLTKSVEQFTPIESGKVRLYACGPTVYDYAHIGNFRTYVLTDILVRTLRYFGYTVKFVTNVTDVGHLTSDSDTGQDKLEKGAKREGKTAWDVAKFYTDAFLEDSKKLNLLEPDVRPKPTEHIEGQIAMVQTLLDKNFAYKIDDGIYFDTAKVENYGALYGQNREEIKEGARVEPNLQKRNPTDFALWKFTPNGVRRDMEWPFDFVQGKEHSKGMGFPGWHIECSAMSRQYLGDQLDIHTGGADLIPIHHTNEIAQSEAATGKVPFSKFWVHGQFIMVEGVKMSKSKGNFYRLADIIEKGFDPLALRYLYLTAHYRSFLNFTWESLTSAQKSLEQLRTQISNFQFQISNNTNKRTMLSEEKVKEIDALRSKFEETISNDMNMPQALAVVWETVKSNIPSPDKYDLLMSFDEVLGLNLKDAQVKPVEIPQEIQELKKKRDEARDNKDFAASDKFRKQAEAQGFGFDDTAQGTVVKKL